MPGKTFKVSASASNVRDAAKIDLRHELGHHLHGLRSLPGETSRIDEAVNAAFQRARATGTAITEYSKSNREEYFAETYAAYFHRKSDLQRHDPNGFAMVERVLHLARPKT